MIHHTTHTQELFLQNGKKKIFGVLTTPEGVERAPLVVFSHGYGGSCRQGKVYADALAPMGYAVFSFDFCGGSRRSRSDGETTEMSVFTEEKDLLAVIKALRSRSDISPDGVILIGESQGGLVAALAAAHHKRLVRSLILLYPALCMRDDWAQRFSSTADIPEEMDFWGLRLGKVYVEGLFDLDIYGTISAYKGPVLILHGEKDPVVPLSYSKRAAQAYPHAHLHVIRGEGHGFSTSGQRRMISAIKAFIQ